jgi:hypothetical protein
MFGGGYWKLIMRRDIFMKQFEYKVEQIQIELKSIVKSDKSLYHREVAEKLNMLGKEGWELSGVDGTWFYFKREIGD